MARLKLFFTLPTPANCVIASILQTKSPQPETKNKLNVFPWTSMVCSIEIASSKIASSKIASSKIASSKIASSNSLLLDEFSFREPKQPFNSA